MNPLKKITLIQKNKNSLLLLLIFFLGFNSLHAQMQNNGALYVNNGGLVYVKSGNYSFGTSSSTKTGRNTSTFGKFIFGAGATHSGAASGSTTDVTNGINLFVDGFSSTLGTSYIVLPTGAIGTTPVYAPIGITNSTLTNGVNAAFTIANLSAETMDATLSALPSNLGKWVVNGDNCKITLIWNSDVSSLSSTIANLTVAGFNVSTNKWEALTSNTPTGSLTSGTIQTTNDVVLANYSAFSLAKKGTSCPPVFAATGTTKTWNGSSWSPSAPTEIDDAVISGTGTPGSFVCNSLAVNANISVTDGQTIEVVNAITGSGVITMSNQASIYQRNDASGISPTINLTKSTRNGMYAYDYIYWGSPLKSSENTFVQLANAQAYTNNNSATSGAVGALDSYYKYVAGDTSTAGGWQTLTSSTAPGVGFITRIKNQAPFSTFQTQNTTDHINLTFSGAVNNGTISAPIANNLASPTSSRNYNLLANPYPSAIDADKFLQYNTDLDGVIYIWKATTPSTGIAASTYTSADYIAFTRAGYTADAGISGTVFSGQIATGQGFRVKAITASGTGNVTFNNCMRISGGNTSFMRNSNTALIDRYKLNFKGANNVGNQILIAYMPETTMGYDRMYDAELSSVSPAQMYSLLDNSNTQLGINARPIFTSNDVVAIGIDKSNTTAENFTIAISEKEGIFQTNEINVLLHDKVLNIYRNLADGPYEFVSNSVQLQNRFEIVYQNSALGTPDFDPNSVFATINNQILKIKSSFPVSNVSVYDITGRLITDFSVDNQLEVNNPFIFSTGIYVVKIKMNNGAIATQKLIYKK